MSCSQQRSNYKTSKLMENLIEKSYELDPNCVSVSATGEERNYYKIISVQILDGDDVIHYDIRRSHLPSATSFISMRKKGILYAKKHYWKAYTDNVKFENAIKRIEKMIK